MLNKVNDGFHAQSEDINADEICLLYHLNASHPGFNIQHKINQGTFGFLLELATDNLVSSAIISAAWPLKETALSHDHSLSESDKDS